MARACLYPRQPRKDPEDRGRKEGTVTTIQKGGNEAEDRVTELRRELCEVQMARAVEKASGVLSTVSATEDDGRPRLGPTVLVDVEVNNVKTPALVDTGSPATIISLDFVLKVLAEQRDRSLTPALWKDETLKKFSVPEVELWRK